MVRGRSKINHRTKSIPRMFEAWSSPAIASIWLTAATPGQNHRNLPRLRAAMRYYGIPQVAHVRPPFTVPIARGPRIRSGVYGHPHSLRSSSLPLLGARGFPRAKTHEDQSRLTIMSNCLPTIYPPVNSDSSDIGGVATFLFVSSFLFFFSNRFVRNNKVYSNIYMQAIKSRIIFW